MKATTPSIEHPSNIDSSVRSITASIPKRSQSDGPVTRARWRRTLSLFTVAWIIGGFLQFADVSTQWKAFGLGLIVPGAGFLYAAHPLLAVVCFALFWVSLFVLWLLGPVLLPPLVLIGGAALAAVMTQNEVWAWSQLAIPAFLALYIAQGWYRAKIRFIKEQAAGAKLNEQLHSVTFPASPRPSQPEVTESSAEDLQALRYCLDLALQPIDRWDGFSNKDQFREGALRYQLNFSQYACVMSQYTRTPAFRGYLAEAQRNLIEKQLDPINWTYWRWENLWGNLSWDPDPCIRDNVMLSGYWAVMVGLYQSVNEDFRYAVPGALTFRNGAKEVYPYDFGRLAGVMNRQMMNDPMCLFSCEPSWIYPFCASYAMNTLVLHDRMHNTGYCREALPQYRRKFEEEFLTADGKTIFIKNGRWGFNLPVPGTQVSDATIVYWCNSFMPDIAQRLWWTMRRTDLRMHDGQLDLVLPLSATVDAGNYAFNDGLFARGVIQYAAREMGDEEVYQALQQQLDERAAVEVSDGRRRYPKLSVYGNVQHVLARFGRKNAMHEMINQDLPEAWRKGPILEGVPYPEVLVAKAVSDGRALDLVLLPGATHGRFTLKLSRLTPLHHYRLEGAVGQEISVGEDGSASIEVDLFERKVLRICPID
jgi:hypothetical protein